MTKNETHNDSLFLEINNAIATIFINRINKRNALSYEMWTKVPAIMKACEENSEVKVIIFRSVDASAFSAGADISDFKNLCQTAEGAKKYNDAIIAAEAAIMNISKPTIAQIQGFCVGGGCEIAIACDFRFADSSGRFGITPAKLGLIYNTPGTKNLVDLVGPSKAKDILFTGRLLPAEEALSIGLIDHIFSSEMLEKETLEYAKMIANNAQLSVRSSKRIIFDVLQGETENTEEIDDMIVNSFLSDDFKEGVNAFLEKRRANFKYS